MIFHPILALMMEFNLSMIQFKKVVSWLIIILYAKMIKKMNSLSHRANRQIDPLKRKVHSIEILSMVISRKVLNKKRKNTKVIWVVMSQKTTKWRKISTLTTLVELKIWFRKWIRKEKLFTRRKNYLLLMNLTRRISLRIAWRRQCMLISLQAHSMRCALSSKRSISYWAVTRLTTSWNQCFCFQFKADSVYSSGISHLSEKT